MSPAVAHALILTLQVYTYVILARVILSWFVRDPANPIVRILGVLTDPVLGPLSRILSFGGIDLSPLVVLLALQAAQRLIAASVG